MHSEAGQILLSKCVPLALTNECADPLTETLLPALGCCHLDLHLYQPQEIIPAPGFHSGCPSKGAGRLLQGTDPKGVVLLTAGSCVTSVCFWFQALTKGSRGTAGCAVLLPTLLSESNCSPAEGEGFQHGKPAKTKTCRLEAKPSKLGWMGCADISATFNYCRNRAEK